MDRSSAAGLAGGTLTTGAPGETERLGTRLGEAAEPGTVLALIGELGAGKTQLTKGVARGLGVRGVVNSPTFVLMNEHPGRLRLYHIDAYRLGDPEEAVAAGLLDDRQADGVTVIEWADRIGAWLPAERLAITLDIGEAPDQRRIRWEARGAAHERLASRAFAAS